MTWRAPSYWNYSDPQGTKDEAEVKLIKALSSPGALWKYVEDYLQSVKLLSMARLARSTDVDSMRRIQGQIAFIDEMLFLRVRAKREIEVETERMDDVASSTSDNILDDTE